MEKTARKYITDLAIKFVKENLTKINEDNKDRFSRDGYLDKTFIGQLRTEEWAIDWLLSELLDQNYWKDYIVKEEWIEDNNQDKLITVYRFGDKYIQTIFYRDTDFNEYHNYSFVKLKKKRITIFVYE